MSATKRAPEIIIKRSGETKKVNMEFEKELAASETISSVDDTTITPTGELTAIPSASGTKVQYTIAAGTAEQTFTGDSSSDICTASSHGLSDGYTVHVFADGEDDLPSGLNENLQYFIVTSTTDTFQLARSSGGDAVSLGSDGQGTIAIDYIVQSTITSSNSQVIIGEGVCQVRL